MELRIGIPLRGALLLCEAASLRSTSRRPERPSPARPPGNLSCIILPSGLSKNTEPDICRRRDALPAHAPPLAAPSGPVRIPDRGLKLAGIPKTDSRGWTVDVRALRHTFGPLLSKGNVAPRVAQAAMRHSTIDLTMNVYTDPELLDVAGALDALPELPLVAVVPAGLPRLRATGTEAISAGRQLVLRPQWHRPLRRNDPSHRIANPARRVVQCSGKPTRRSCHELLGAPPQRIQGAS